MPSSMSRVLPSRCSCLGSDSLHLTISVSTRGHTAPSPSPLMMFPPWLHSTCLQLEDNLY